MVSYFVLRAYDAMMINVWVTKPQGARSSRLWSKSIFKKILSMAAISFK